MTHLSFGLVSNHRALETAVACGRETFISDWNGSHPFANEFLGELASSPPIKTVSGQYIFFDEQADVIEAIARFHQSVENLALSPKNILAGQSSSSLLAALTLWLLKEGHTKAHYIPPLYFTIHYFRSSMRLETIPISSRHIFQDDFCMDLPRQRTVLFMTDPVWYAGVPFSRSQIERIASWQKETGSLVIVDGSFQYLQWGDDRLELSSLFDPNLTFRVICPTKALALPSFRFAYLLHPAWAHEDFLFLYESLVGSCSVADLAFARRCLSVLSSLKGNRPLTTHLRSVYEKLRIKGHVTTEITPSCGYFIFGKAFGLPPNVQLMNQDYFELTDIPDYFRINLMLARDLFLGSSFI